jgi:hypothetical protein
MAWDRCEARVEETQPLTRSVAITCQTGHRVGHVAAARFDTFNEEEISMSVAKTPKSLPKTPKAKPKVKAKAAAPKASKATVKAAAAKPAAKTVKKTKAAKPAKTTAKKAK